MKFPSFEISLPGWVDAFFASAETVIPVVNDRMDIAIELSRQNIIHQTGGPFGAALFNSDTGKLIAPGVNLVTSAGSSILHAEVVAITIAQIITGCYDLAQAGNCELVTSSEPCAMCMGAIHWSGVKRIVCGARDADVRQIGFDEGIKPDDWQKRYKDMGIDVISDIRRQQANNILKKYSSQGGQIYNSSSK